MTKSANFNKGLSLRYYSSYVTMDKSKN